MDLFKFLNAGVVRSGIYAHSIKKRREKLEAFDAYQIKALEECRALWLNALLADQTRGWLSIASRDAGLLKGMTVILTAATMAGAHESQDNYEQPVMDVFRQAIGAAHQCAAGDCLISLEHATLFDEAAEAARTILKECSVGAIGHAAQQLHALAKQRAN